jgi:hypothetical protein
MTMPSNGILPSSPVCRIAFAALLGLSCVGGASGAVHADQGGYRGGHEFREREFHREQFRDSRYHHDHYYPPRGYRFSVLPPHPRVIVHGGQPFYFSGGVWYRPVNRGYVVVRPPVGVIVPVLPFYYTRVWVGPYPYYYANDVYYVRSAQGYAVVDQPPGVISMSPPPGVSVAPDNAVTELGPADFGAELVTPVAGLPPQVAAPPAATVAQAGGDQLFVYPRQGQTTEQQNRDRAECNSWAAGQTGRAPSGAGMDPNFVRALSACLDGRGYTVK